MSHAVVAETAREANIGKIATEYQRYAHDRSFQTVGEELDVLLTHAATCGATHVNGTDTQDCRCSPYLGFIHVPLILALRNLTLLTESLNPSIENAAWASKREKIARSLLALNRDVVAKSEWSEGEIELRSAKLAVVSNRIWALRVARAVAKIAGS